MVWGKCKHFQVHFQKNQISNLPLIQKQIFQGVKNVKNCITTLNFRFSGKLGSLITSRHAFRSSWNFQKLMQVRYTSDLRTFQVVKIFFNFNVKYFFSKRTVIYIHILGYFRGLGTNVEFHGFLILRISESFSLSFG